MAVTSQDFKHIEQLLVNNLVECVEALKNASASSNLEAAVNSISEQLSCQNPEHPLVKAIGEYNIEHDKNALAEKVAQFIARKKFAYHLSLIVQDNYDTAMMIQWIKARIDHLACRKDPCLKFWIETLKDQTVNKDLLLEAIQGLENGTPEEFVESNDNLRLGLINELKTIQEKDNLREILEAFSLVLTTVPENTEDACVSSWREKLLTAYTSQIDLQDILSTEDRKASLNGLLARAIHGLENGTIER